MASSGGVPDEVVSQENIRTNHDLNDQAENAAPDEQQHLESAPTSEQADDDLDVENHSPSDPTNKPDNEVSQDKREDMGIRDAEDEDGENKGEVGHGDDGTSAGDGDKDNGDDLQTVSGGEEKPIVTLYSDSEDEVQSGGRRDIPKSSDSESTESNFDSSNYSSTDESNDGGDRQVEAVNQTIRDVDVPEGTRASISLTDGYSSTDIGAINVPRREMRPYDWVSKKVLALESYY